MHVVFAPNAQRELQVQNDRLRRENGALVDELERLRRELSLAHTENEGLRVGRAAAVLPLAALPPAAEEARAGAAVAAPALPSQAETAFAAPAVASATAAEDPIPVARRMAPREVLSVTGQPSAAPVRVIHVSSSVRNHARPTIFVSAIGGGRNPTGPTVQMMAPPNGPTVQMVSPSNGSTIGTRPHPTSIPQVAPGGGSGPRVFLMAGEGMPDAALAAMPAPPSGPQTVVGAPRDGTWPAVQMLPGGATRQGSGWPTVAVADIAPNRGLVAPAVQVPAVGQVVAAAPMQVPLVAAPARSALSREAARPIMQLTAANVLPEELDQALGTPAAPVSAPSHAAAVAVQNLPAVTVQAVAPTPSRAVAVARSAGVMPDAILRARGQQPVAPGRFLQPAARNVRSTAETNAIALPAAPEPLDDAATRFAMLELD